jgi:serine/threonine protein kinase, bacterial
MTVSSSVFTIAPNPPIHPRFVVLEVLAASDFGWEYLVKDLDRRGEQDRGNQDRGNQWVLEEFLPSAETPDNLLDVQVALQSAIDEIVHLDHPQLAKSQEVLLLGDRLFWVREYVPGLSYRVLWEQRLERQEVFSELEVRSLLLQVLPVLSELHQQQIFHCHLDLDSLMLRQPNQLLVMTRYGEMRDLGIAAGFYLVKPLRSWSLEANLEGVDRDLHDLAYVAMILLTGEESPDSLTSGIQQAVEEGRVTEDLAAILYQMLIPQPWQCFRSANQVYETLLDPGEEAVLLERPYRLEQPRLEQPRLEQPRLEQPNLDYEPNLENLPSPTPPRRDPLLMFLSMAFITLMSIALWRITTSFPQFKQAGLLKPPINNSADNPTANSNPPNANNSKSTAIDQAEKLGISSELIDRLKQEIPNSTSALNQQLNRLSEEARNGLGTYYRKDYDRWFATLADMKISQPTIDILADTLFFLRFPELQGKTLNPRTLGQIWYAIARDQITALNQKKNIEILKAGTFNQSGQLTNGQSRIFQIKVNPGQALELKLNGSMQALRLSVIENEIVLIRYSTNTQWSAPKSLRGGTYEIILTPMKLDAVPYQLSLSSPGK